MGKVRKIIKVPDSKLRLKCLEVDVQKFRDGLSDKTLDNLKETQIHYKAYGISANQIGSYKRICIAINTVLINPKFIRGEGRIVSKERCLSVPANVEKEINRFERVTVSYYDEKGNEKTETFEGLKALVVQHELDHLDGKLITD